MVRLPKLSLESIFSIIDKTSDAIDNGLDLIDKVSDKLDRLGISEAPSTIPTRSRESLKEGLSPATLTQTSPEEKPAEDVATACVACAIGHYAGAARLLNEAIRFRDDGLESNQVIDDIAGAIGELNAMERVDLTPERLQKTPDWERAIADEALRESRKLRHRLESITSMEEVEKAAADTESYYKKLNRQWYKGRFAKLGTKKSEAISQRVGSDARRE